MYVYIHTCVYIYIYIYNRMTYRRPGSADSRQMATAPLSYIISISIMIIISNNKPYQIIVYYYHIILLCYIVLLYYSYMHIGYLIIVLL